jgi:hypothetical protein
MLLLQAYAEFLPGDRLGLTVRGGREFGLGVFVTGVERGSIARAMGLQVSNVSLQYTLVRGQSTTHTVLYNVHCNIYKEYHSVCPLVGIGTLPPPLSPASVSLTPEPGGGGGGTLTEGERLGEFLFR